MGTIRERGDFQYQAIIRLKGYPHKTKTFEREKDAKDWIRKTEATMIAGTYAGKTEEDATTFCHVLKRYLNEETPKHKGAVSETYRLNFLIRQDIAKYKLTALSRAVLRDYRNNRLRAVLPGTVRRELELMRSILNHAIKEWEYEIENPVEAIKLPAKARERNRRLGVEEERRLIEALTALPRNQDGTFAKCARNPWLLPALLFAIETAMRRSEILRLDWKHVDLELQTAYLPDTKNGDDRTVPLSSRAVDILRALDRVTAGPVFPISANALKKGYQRAIKRAQSQYAVDCAANGVASQSDFLQDLRFHDCRHEATSRLATKLSNVLELKAVTGHKDIRMLDRYYHPRAEDLAKKLG